MLIKGQKIILRKRKK